MTMKNIKAKIAEHISKKFEIEASLIESMLEYPPDKSMGDLALPCFRLSKSLRRSPVEIAKTLAQLNPDLLLSIQNL